MTDIRPALAFARQLYTANAKTAFAGYVRRDPLARLTLAPGRDNPYAIYERLRERGRISPTRLGNWVTTSHRVSNTVLRSRHFGVRLPGTSPDGDDVNLSFLDMEPPDHTRLRRLAQPAFSPKHLDEFRPRIEAIVDRLLDTALADGRFDLVPALAAPLPIAVITSLLGIPDPDADRFARLGMTIGGALDGIRSLRHAARLRAAQAEMNALFEDLFALRRADPADDLVSRVVAEEGAAVRPEEMLPLCVLLLVAGFETTVNLIGNGVAALLAHPDQWELLRADPAARAPGAVEEVLRYDPPVQRTGRLALDAVELDGVRVRRGQYVITLIGAANRDPDVYPDPARFDITREPGVEHLAFSSGIHYCVGQPLARLEATVALRALAERAPALRRAGRLRRRNATTIRGPIHLPVAA